MKQMFLILLTLAVLFVDQYEKTYKCLIWIPSREQGGLMQIFPFPSATPEPNPVSSPALQENTCCSLFPQSRPLISPIASLLWPAALPQTPNKEGIAWETTGHSGQGSRHLNCTSLPLCSSKSNSLISYLALRQNICCYPNPIFSSSHRSSTPNFLSLTIALSQTSTFSDTPLVPTGHSDQGSK